MALVGAVAERAAEAGTGRTIHPTLPKGGSESVNKAIELATFKERRQWATQ